MFARGVARLGLLVLGLLLAACSSTDTQPASVRFPDLVRAPPQPSETELHLTAGFGSCGGEAEGTDVEVEETDTEVVVSATVRTEGPFFSCEVRGDHEPFSVELEQPLGERSGIDVSDGERRTLWEPALREGIRRMLAFTDEDAERFLLAKRPAYSAAKCDRVNDQYFECMANREGNNTLIFIRAGRTGEPRSAPDDHAVTQLPPQGAGSKSILRRAPTLQPHPALGRGGLSPYSEDNPPVARD